MTPDRLNAEYARQLRLMAKLRIEHEKPRHLRLLAREAERRPGARLPGPDEGYEIAVWADLHLSDERIRWACNRPWPTAATMDAHLRERWRRAAMRGTTMVCAGDLGGQTIKGAGWQPPCAGLPGPSHAVLGNHDFTRFLWREKPLGTDRTSMTLLIETDPPLLVTHVPLWKVPDGCVNVHGHEHDFKPLRMGPWINVSVEQTRYYPVDVRKHIMPLARALACDRIPPGDTTWERIRYTYAVSGR